MSDIISFSGEYFFLSNFYPCPITISGRVFPTLEHAYVSEKTDDEIEKENISNIETPGQVKRYGREISLKNDWEKVKVSVMRSLVNQKFSNTDLLNKLLATEGRTLIEGNQWGDRFWGQCPVGTGRNELGKILMSIRDEHILFS